MVIVRGPLLWLSAATLAWAAAGPVSPGEPAYREADRLFVAKLFQQSGAALEEALRLDPKLVPALTLKAKLAMAMDRFDLARQSLDRALAAEPHSASAHFLYGLQFYLKNDLTAALPHFREARRLNPGDARSSLYLGLTCESLGSTDEALALYQDAARLERAALKGPQAETLLAGAKLLMILGRIEESETWVRLAIQANPNLRDAHFDYARLLIQKGDAMLAVAEAQSALRLSEGTVTDTQIHFLLSRAYKQQGMLDKAAIQSEMVRALETPPRQR